ncbi:MAG: transcriptional regulator [Rhodospirillaceae bacterium]|nr:transcriptional regulator [Rhodospirillaceae bacterium]|tara:strand:- start:780 stop:1223 length:444 start_codon:yes stop_codon:yes gene_type:complete
MAEENNPTVPNGEVLKMAVEIVSAYVSNNTVGAAQVPEVINTVYTSLSSLNDQSADSGAEPPKPAVSIRRSVTPDYIVCLEDGKKLKMLKRHLRASYGMTPDEYRAKWGLPPDYPMVAPNYAEQRSNFAKRIGLGRKKGEKVPRRRK